MSYPIALENSRRFARSPFEPSQNRRLSNEGRNSILMTCHYQYLGSASDWLCCERIFFQPVRSTTKIWVVTCHQYGISAFVTQTSFCKGLSGDLAKRRLFSQATYTLPLGRDRASSKTSIEDNLPQSPKQIALHADLGCPRLGERRNNFCIKTLAKFSRDGPLSHHLAMTRAHVHEYQTRGPFLETPDNVPSPKTIYVHNILQ